MKYHIITLLALATIVGCIKAPADLEPTFWDPETSINELGTVTDSSFQLNNTNERVYTVRFSIDWDMVPEVRQSSILSIIPYNNGVAIPITKNEAYKPSYSVVLFAKPGQTTCLTFAFNTSTGGITRQFDLMCVDVP